MTYLGDAVESINKLVSCPAHREWLYHISSSKAFSERQIVDAICQSLGDKVERIDNTLEEGYRVILSNELTYMTDRTEPYDLGEQEFHLAFVADDMEKAHALHEKMGCICMDNPDIGVYFVTDPDGYWIEVIPPRK